MNNKELIQKLKTKKIIDEYGYIDVFKLEDTYGEQELKEIMDNTTLEDIYETYTVDELYDIVHEVTMEVLETIEAEQTPILEAKRIVVILETIHKKEMEELYYV